jgi:hypothetical protein
MNEATEDDLLDQQLRNAAPYIDDEGFTARVLQQLPQSRAGRRSVRAPILLGITVLGCLLSYLLSGGGRFIEQGVAWLAGLPVLWVLALALGCGIVVTGLGITAAIANNRQLQTP